MKNFIIYFPEGKMNHDCELDCTFKKVYGLTALDLNECFNFCQNENNTYQVKAGNRSLSIGDVILDIEEQDVYMVMPVGFKKVNIILPELKGKMYNTLIDSNITNTSKLSMLIKLAIENSLINPWEETGLRQELGILAQFGSSTHSTLSREYISAELDKTVYNDLKARIVKLSNGKKVANFSSAHSFTFTDNTVLPGVSIELCQKLELKVNENISKNGDVKLSFEITPEIRKEMNAWEFFMQERICRRCILPFTNG